MTKEELIQFLKEHLNIHIQTESWYDHKVKIKVEITFEGETIAKDHDYIDLG